MSQIIIDYKMKQGETLEQALWSSGIYRKKDVRTFKEVAEGIPKMETTVCDGTYLLNGICEFCSSHGYHYNPACVGNKMKKIINLTFDRCAICFYGRAFNNSKVCISCKEWDDRCSCSTPQGSLADYCLQEGVHDKEYYRKKREAWSIRLAALGIAPE